LQLKGRKEMECKSCHGAIVPVDEVAFDHIQGEWHVSDRRARMVIAHKWGYHLDCFEGSFDSFKRCLLIKKAEKERNENRD
jgi:hypothetical protein